MNNSLISDLENEERTILLSKLLRYFQLKSSISFLLSENISQEIWKLHSLNLEKLEEEIIKIYEITLEKTKIINIERLSDAKKLFILKEILEYFIEKIKLLLSLTNSEKKQLEILLSIDPYRLNNELLEILKIWVNDN